MSPPAAGGGTATSGPEEPQTVGPEERSAPGAGWLFGAVGAILFLAGLLVWSPFPAGVWHDDGVYVLLGRALAEGEGLRYVGVSGAPPAPKFPPLYPLTVAGLWGFLSEVGRVATAAGLLNLAFLAGAGALFARLLHRHLGASPRWALGLTLVAWLPLTLWRTALVSFSEPLFLLLFVIGLSAAFRVEARPGDRWAVGLFVLATLAAVYVRTVGVVLAVAVAGTLLIRGRRTAAGGVVAGVGAGVVPWAVWSTRAGREIVPPLRDVLGPYSAWLWRQIRTAPGEYLEALHGSAVDLVHRSASVLLPAPPALEGLFDQLRWWALLAFVPALILGTDRLWKRSPTPTLVLVAYLAVVWLWPFRDDRLLAPVAPLLVLTVLEGFRWAGEGAGLSDAREEKAHGDAVRSAPRRLASGWRGLGALWLALFVGVSAWGMAAGWPGAGYEVRSRALARAVRAVDDDAPSGAVIGAPELWAGLHLYTGRTVVPSARFLPVRPDGPSWGTPEEQFRLWAETGVDHVVMEHGGRVHGDAVERLTSICGEEAARTVTSWRGGSLVRLAWSPGCRRRLLGARPDS